MKSTRRATIAAVTVTSVLAMCAMAISTAAATGTKTVTISVASLIPGSTQAAKDQFNAQVAEFEKANPSIKRKPIEYQWLGATARAKPAAGPPPIVLTVPLSDARTLRD